MASSRFALDPAAPVPRQGYRWAVLAAATLTQACACFLIQGLGVLGPFIQAELHLTATHIGLLMSAAQAAPIIGLLVAGELLDRFGERLIVAAGTGVVALALIGASHASGYAGLLLWLVVVGAGYSTVQPGGSQSVSRWFSRSQRGLAMGIRQAGLPLGGALAAVVLPAVAASSGWRGALLAGAALASAGAAIFLLVCRSPGPRSAPDDKLQAPWAWRGMLHERRTWLANPQLRGAVWSGVALISTQVCVLMFVVADLHERLKVSIEAGAGLLALMLGAGALGRIVLASWSDHSRWGRHLPILTCLMATALGLSILVLGPAGWGMANAALAIWIGFFGFGWYGPWVACVSEAAPPGRMGSALAMTMAFNQVAIVVCPPAWGLLRDYSGRFVLGWTGLTAMLLLAATLIVPLLRRHPLSQQGTPP